MDDGGYVVNVVWGLPKKGVTEKTFALDGKIGFKKASLKEDRLGLFPRHLWLFSAGGFGGLSTNLYTGVDNKIEAKKGDCKIPQNSPGDKQGII